MEAQLGWGSRLQVHPWGECVRLEVLAYLTPGDVGARRRGGAGRQWELVCTC